MPLIEMTSDLTSLKFGRDRRGGGDSGQPYFTKDIPGRLQSINFANSFLGNDFLVRGGVASGVSILQDELRLTKFLSSFKSPNGLLFTAKQQLLSQQEPLTGAGPGRFYLPTSTLAQAAVNPIGVHFTKQGKKLKLDDDEKYFKLTKEVYNTNTFGKGNKNKLLLLYETNIISPTAGTDIPPAGEIDQALQIASLTNDFSAFDSALKDLKTGTDEITAFGTNLSTFGISQNPTLLQNYRGGPNSIIGNKTIIRRVFNTQEGLIANKNVTVDRNKFLLYTPNLIIKRSSTTGVFRLVGNTRNTGFGGTGVTNFTREFSTPSGRTETNVSEERKNQLIGKPTNYNDFNRVKTYGEPDVGNEANTRDRSVYYDTDLKNNILTGTERDKIYRPDEINAKPLYITGEESAKAGEGYDDIVKFNIGVIDLDGNSENRDTTWIHFRAYINGFSDAYQSTWNPVKYMGRGNSFYKYDGYTRAINMDFRVVVHSKYEQSIIYDKLNYLASVTAPNYAAGGFMRGNLIKVTVGDYLNNTVGILNGLSYSIPPESPWDIGRNSEGKQDDNSLQMPFIVDVGGFSFTPIHNFIDKTVSNDYISKGKAKPDQRYISLGADGKGYAIGQKIRNIENEVKVENLLSTLDNFGI